MTKKILSLCCLLVAPLVFVNSQNSNATILTYGFDKEFSGATKPVGIAPWLTATVDDSVTGEVTITLDSSGLTDDEFVMSWFFNFNPSLNAASFLPGPIDTADAQWVYWVAGNDYMQADGDSGGKYDYQFKFQDANNDAGRFTANETFSVTFLSTTLTAYDFDFGNTGSTKGGPFYMAAHVGGIGRDGQDSGWIAATGAPVPEPATMLLFGAGLAGLAGVARRKKNG